MRALFHSFVSSRVHKQLPAEDGTAASAIQGGERATPRQLQPQSTPTGTTIRILPIDEDGNGSNSTNNHQVRPSTDTGGEIQEQQGPRENGPSNAKPYQDTIAEAASESQILIKEAMVNVTKEETSHDDQVISLSGVSQALEETQDHSSTPPLPKPLVQTVIHRVSD